MNRPLRKREEHSAMKAIRCMGVALAILMVFAGLALAGTETRLGTGGAPELRLPVGARSIALSGSDLGSISGVEALYYNPAGLAATDKQTEVAFSYTRYIADMNLNYFAVAQSLGDLGMLGVSVKVLSIGDIVQTTETAPDGTGNVFSPTFSTLGLTYAKRMTDRVNFGATVGYVSERILQETAAGMVFDFGFQYDTGYHGAKLGMAMKNFGSNLEFTGSDFESNQQPPGSDPQSGVRTFSAGSARFELPSHFEMGMSFPFMQGVNNLTGFAVYQSNSYT